MVWSPELWQQELEDMVEKCAQKVMAELEEEIMGKLKSLSEDIIGRIWLPGLAQKLPLKQEASLESVNEPVRESVLEPSPALKGTEDQKIPDSSKQQAINKKNDFEPKEELELKTEATIYEQQVKANYERKKPETVIIDAIPVTDGAISSGKINLNGNSWDYSTSEKFDSELSEGKISSLGKPSVGRSIEKIPKK